MYCGLDFGTSNSLCAIEGKEGDAELVAVDQGHTDIPSAIFYPMANLTQPIHGREAISEYIEGVEGRLFRSFKRLLGTTYFPSGTMLTSSKKLTFQDLFVNFISHVKSAAERQTDQPLTEVVLGRPIRFSAQESAHKSGERDLESIANAIGFKHVAFQYEPIAAAFAHERNLTQESLAIVVDIGGGTSDFSVLRLGPDRIKAMDRSADILANSGLAMGGTDFDSLLSREQVMEHFGYKSTYGPKEIMVPNWPYISASDWNRIAMELYARKTYMAMKGVLRMAQEPQKITHFLKLLEDRRAHHLLREVEAAKITLSNQDTAIFVPDFMSERIEIRVNRKDFEESMGQKMDSLIQTAGTALQDAGVQPDQIGLIIMTGGVSAMPVVQRVFSGMFPAAQLSAENKMGSVCEGLLYDARRKFA